MRWLGYGVEAGEADEDLVNWCTGNEGDVLLMNGLVEVEGIPARRPSGRYFVILLLPLFESFNKTHCLSHLIKQQS